MRTSALFGADFLNLWCVRTDRRGLSQCGQGGRGGQFLAILYGRLLWTAP